MKMSYIVRYLICTLLVCVTIGISSVLTNPTHAASSVMVSQQETTSFNMEFSGVGGFPQNARDAALNKKVRFEQENAVSCTIYDEAYIFDPGGTFNVAILYTTCTPR